MLKKVVVKNWILSKSKNLEMGTSSKAQFMLTVRTVSVYIAKVNILMRILFILLY